MNKVIEECTTGSASSRICELGTTACETYHTHTGQHSWRDCTYCAHANWQKNFNVRKHVYPRLFLTVQQSMMLYWQGDKSALYPCRIFQPRKRRHEQKGQPGTSTR